MTPTPKWAPFQSRSYKINKYQRVKNPSTVSKRSVSKIITVRRREKLKVFLSEYVWRRSPDDARNGKKRTTPRRPPPCCGVKSCQLCRIAAIPVGMVPLELGRIAIRVAGLSAKDVIRKLVPCMPGARCWHNVGKPSLQVKRHLLSPPMRSYGGKCGLGHLTIQSKSNYIHKRLVLMIA